MSKITFLVIVYAPCLNKTTIKTNKKQLNSSADTFFLITLYLEMVNDEETVIVGLRGDRISRKIKNDEIVQTL